MSFNVHFLHAVRQHGTARGGMERQQRRCEDASQCILFRGQHQQYWVHPAAFGEPKRPCKGGQDPAKMEGRSSVSQSGT